MITSPTRHRLLAATAGLVLAAGLVACGADDQADDDTTDHTEHPATTLAPADPTAPADTTATPGTDGSGAAGTVGDLALQCENYTIVSGALVGAGDPSAAEPALDALGATPPAEIADAAGVFVDGFRAALGGDGAAFETPEFGAALGEVGDYFFDHCDLAARIEATGADYAFAGVPDEVPAGVVGVRFVNISASGEPHELFLMRRPEGDTRTVDEIAALDAETVFREYQPVGVAFANTPSASMSILLDLEAGEYVAICNLPTQGDEADPHAHHGMVAELSVA